MQSEIICTELSVFVACRCHQLISKYGCNDLCCVKKKLVWLCLLVKWHPRLREYKFRYWLKSFHQNERKTAQREARCTQKCCDSKKNQNAKQIECVHHSRFAYSQYSQTFIHTFSIFAVVYIRECGATALCCSVFFAHITFSLVFLCLCVFLSTSFSPLYLFILSIGTNPSMDNKINSN